MIPMKVGKVNVVGLDPIQEFTLDLRKIPPTTPIARSNKPGVKKDGLTSMLQEHSGVTKNRKLHSSLTMSMRVEKILAHPATVMYRAIAAIRSASFQEFPRLRTTLRRSLFRSSRAVFRRGRRSVADLARGLCGSFGLRSVTLAGSTSQA